MKKVNRIGNRVKPARTMRLEEIAMMEIDAKVELIQTLIPLGLMHVEEELTREVERLAGPRHCRGEGLPGHVRWGRQGGSVYLLDQKVPVNVPRVRDRARGTEVPLPLYRSLQSPRGADVGLFASRPAWHLLPVVQGGGRGDSGGSGDVAVDGFAAGVQLPALRFLFPLGLFHPDHSVRPRTHSGDQTPCSHKAASPEFRTGSPFRLTPHLRRLMNSRAKGTGEEGPDRTAAGACWNGSTR